jgi:HAD superfamily hydrolase (TIGR01549 family)
MKFDSIIFDLDETIADTRFLREYRRQRNWKYVFSNLHLVKAFQGMPELILSLSSLGYKIGVLSSSPSSYLKTILKQIDVNPDIVVGYHDCPFRKPDPRLLSHVLNKLDAKSPITVGDSLLDYNLSKNSHCPFILVSWGEVESEITDEYAYFAKTPTDVLRIVRQISTSSCPNTHGINCFS